MKHAFVMNCHVHLAQAARTTELLRRYWSDRSSIYFYYDGKHDYDPAQFARVRANCDRILVGPYEQDKCHSIFNALNALVDHADNQGHDVVSFLHEDMIPLYRGQFYGFLDRFYESGKVMTYSKVWPTQPFVDFINIHVRVRAARQRKMFPIHKVVPNYAFNEAQAMFSFNLTSPGWQAETYPMWAMVWPLTGVAKILNPPHFYPPHADKVGHAHDGQFTFHNYVPESSVMHVNDAYFWDNYEALSDIGPRPDLPVPPPLRQPGA